MGNAADMKAGIYSPYWDTLGGGEYYAANVARVLNKLGYSVEIFSNDKQVIEKLTNRFNINLRGVTVNTSATKAFSNGLINKYKFTKKYDALFVVSDGSIPLVFSKNNVIHFQVPFIKVGGHKLSNQFKLKSYSHVVCNSKFTKRHIDKEFKVKSKVVYPAVDAISNQLPSRRNKVILSVGRFDNLMQSKRQDLLIKTFKRIRHKGWKLVLLGGVLHGTKYVEKLKEMAEGYDIEIHTNVSHIELKHYYETSKIFWHAAGYGLDIKKTPQKAEHFGISTVEAMSAGLVPVVFNGGGLKEIITNKTGYLFKTENELLEKTKKAIKMSNDHKSIERIIERSKLFSTKVFDEKITKIFS